MRYTGIWTRMAMNHFTNLWMAAPDRQAVTDASNRIDALLRDDPEKHATPLGKFCVVTVEPLAALFHIDPGDCKVHILSFRLTS